MIHVVMHICVQAVADKKSTNFENQKKTSTLAIKQVYQFKQEFIILSIWESKMLNMACTNALLQSSPLMARKVLKAYLHVAVYLLSGS